MSFIWVVMLLFSIISQIIHGYSNELTTAFLDGASSAIQLSISLAGALCLWSGLAKVMENAGLTGKLGTFMHPVFRRLFPISSRDSVALGYLTANVSANLLGLGNAATPMGIAAVKRMQTLSKVSFATDEMCLLIVMNTASVQLLPTTVAALRSAQGSASPFSILPAVWITSFCSVSAGILAAKLMGKYYHD